MGSFEICKQNWRKRLVSSPESITEAGAQIAERLGKIADEARASQALMKKSLEQKKYNTLFICRKCEKTEDMSAEYEHIRKMALGYATYGTETYDDRQLLSDILFALEWAHNRYYGKAEMENRGWRDIYEFNWYDWKVKTPKFLMDAMVLVDGSLTLYQKRDYLGLFNMLVDKPFDYSSNKVEFGSLMVESGILTENEQIIKAGLDGIEDTYLYVDGGLNDGQGFYRDGSYIFHTRHAMNNMYGLAHFLAQIQLAQLVRGSDYQLDEDHFCLLYEWMDRHFTAFLSRGETLHGVMGRHVGMVSDIFNRYVRAYVNLFDISEQKEKDRVASVIQRLLRENPLIKDGKNASLFASFTAEEYLIYQKALKYNCKTEWSVNGFYAYNCMDRAVQHTDKYAMSLAMSSSRIYDYECINGCNLNGWYIAAGALFCHRGRMQFNEDWWKSLNPYRIPGTTVDEREREAVSIAQGNEYLSGRDFVGSLSVGDFGVSVMEYEGYRSDGELKCTKHYKPSGEYGAAPPKYFSTLFANKAYFFLDGVTVCLGCGIVSRDSAQVYTVVENQLDPAVIVDAEIVGREKNALRVNGKEVTLTEEDVLLRGTEAFEIGEQTVFFFAPTDLKARRMKGFTEIIIPHGKNPDGASYAYAIVPCGRYSEKRAFEKNVKILENSNNVQALADMQRGIAYYAFHRAYACGEVHTDEALLVAVTKKRVYATDPTQKLGECSVFVRGSEYKFDFTEKYGQALSCQLK